MNSQVALLVTHGAALARACSGRFELVELPDRCTVVDLEAERVADPHEPWSRSDVEHVLAVLAERPGYALQLPWRSAR
jgi:hypothetical protein